MMVLRRNALRRVTLAVLFASGCSVYHPYVKPCVKIPDGQATTYEDGLKYAVSARDAYEQAATEQAWIAPAFGTLLIPIGAASLGLGLSGVTGDALLGMGLGGATLLGLGTFLPSRPRQMAYLVGASAVDCAIRVTRPLSRSVDEKEKFNKFVTALESAIADLTSMIENCNETTEGLGDARTTVTNASLTLGKARVAARSMNDGGVLVDSVNRIRDEVNKEVAKNEPDLQRLTADLQRTLSASAGLITGQSGLFTLPAPSTKTAARPTERAARPSPCDKNSLRLARADVQNALRPVETIVNDLEVATKIETCHQNATQGFAEAALRVQPPDTIVLIGKSASKSVVVAGGQPPTTSRMLAPGDTAVELTVSDGGSVVTLKPKLVNDDVVAGSYQMLVADSTVSGRAIVNVEVKKQ
jgi:hypothetical protein